MKISVGNEKIYSWGILNAYIYEYNIAIEAFKLLISHQETAFNEANINLTKKMDSDKEL